MAKGKCMCVSAYFVIVFCLLNINFYTLIYGCTSYMTERLDNVKEHFLGVCKSCYEH